jgi:hypothetical protein
VLCLFVGGAIVLVGAPVLLVVGVKPKVSQLVKWSGWMGVAALVAAIVQSRL